MPACGAARQPGFVYGGGEKEPIAFVIDTTHDDNDPGRILALLRQGL